VQDAISYILSSDGTQLAIGSTSGNISIWETKRLSVLQTMTGHSRTVTRVAWSPNSSLLASGSRDATVCVWNTTSGRLVQEYIGHSGEILDVTWSADGKLIASASKDDTIKLWSVEEKRLVGTLEGHKDQVKGISFSHDGSFLSSKSLDNSVLIWRCDTWQPVAALDELTTQSVGPNISFNPKTLCLATYDKGDSVIRVWELNSSQLLGTVPQVSSVRYRNAKVVLVGDTGVGKTGLGKVLAGEKFKETRSTHGRYVKQLDRTNHELENGQKRFEKSCFGTWPANPNLDWSINFLWIRRALL
jgi:WD40 repeat protein